MVIWLSFLGVSELPMRNLREVEASKRLASRLCLIKITDNLAQQRQAGQDANLLLCLCVKSVLLGSDKIKEGLGVLVERMKSCRLVLSV